MVERKMASPKGLLFPVFYASGGTEDPELVLALGRAWAARGEKVLLVDVQNGALSEHLNINAQLNLMDVLFRGAEVEHAIYNSPDKAISCLSVGKLALDLALGSLAGLSLDYDRVLVMTPPGCTPAHARLAGASDNALIVFDSRGDKFMQAFWKIDAIRRRKADFSPLLMAAGPAALASDTALLLLQMVQEHLGRPAPYIGHSSEPWIAGKVTEYLEKDAAQRFVA